jgi:hypothetical protein
LAVWQPRGAHEKGKAPKKRKKKKKMGMLSLLEGLIGVTESLIAKLMSSSPDATQMDALTARIAAMAATLDAAPP